jgi:DNA-directed RNA polymerase subunit K
MKLTKYEKARLIGARALQLSMGAPLLLDLKEEDFEKMNYNPIEIAKMEFEKGILPITIKRPMPKRMAEA